MVQSAPLPASTLLAPAPQGVPRPAARAAPWPSLETATHIPWPLCVLCPWSLYVVSIQLIRPIRAARSLYSAPIRSGTTPTCSECLPARPFSDLGSQIGDLALPLAAALAPPGDAGADAAISVAEYLPRIVVSPIAGVWIDRIRRKPVLIATNVVRGLLFLAVAMAAGFGWLRMELPTA